MDRIVIIGSPGAGKSTFARRLGDILGIKVYHLDRYFWKSGWHEETRDSRIEIQKRLIQNECWIIEGTYLSSSDERLHAADTIIFLDMPRLLCLFRVLKRRIEYNKKQRPDLAEGCPEKIRFPYLLKVLVFPERGRKLFFQKKKEIEVCQQQDETKTAFQRLSSSQEVEAFLHTQHTRHQFQHALPTYEQPTFSSAALSAVHA